MPQIKVDWDNWSAFLPQIEAAYSVRHKQHFSTDGEYPEIVPSGRDFYEQPWKIDGGRLMYDRFLNDEFNVAELIDYGWKVVFCTDKKFRLVPQPTFREFIDAYYMGLEMKKIDKPFTELALPALPFRRNQPLGNCLDDNAFIRPGIDEVPNHRTWSLMLGDDKGVIDVPLDLFQHVLCSNRPPMNPVMFDHDGAHLIDNTNYPEFYQANKDFYARVCEKHPTKSVLYISENPAAGNPYTLYGRSCVMHEETCLPNLNQELTIRALLPHWFNKKFPVANAALYFDMFKDHEQVLDEAKTLVSFMPKLVTRHGGGMSDPYNLYNDLNIRSKPEKRIPLRHRRSRYFWQQGRELFSQAAIESLLGLTHDLEWLLGIYKPDDPPRMEEIIDSLWRIEAALYMGVTLQITPDKFARETTEQFMDPNSDSFRYLSAWVPKGSLMWELYLSIPAQANV